MRVPPDVTKCVCFLSVKVKNKSGVIDDHFIGTGFYVAVTTKHSAYYYLVTAWHILKQARERGYSQFYVRLNYQQGGSEVIPIGDNWVYPDNPAIDIAVLPHSPHGDIFDHMAIPIESFIKADDDGYYGNFQTSKGEDKKSVIGIGDELLITGLFNRHWGHQRNMPIVREGMIAAMPDKFEEWHKNSEEENAEEECFYYDAYLVEMRSIGGLSGSPVFALKTEINRYTGPPLDLPLTSTLAFLLGIIRGHWSLNKQNEADANFTNGEDKEHQEGEEDDERDRLNIGIAQVTPISDVLNLINGDELMKQREENDRKQATKHKLTLDVNLPKKQSESSGITQEGFTDALKRASRKIEQDEEKQ
ncbi:MAG TPA: hypothetical protein VGN95_21030 [Pyrinomonadaceae bacterium]|jgi:hypothetical protein|nr:hypothetical protein [Pyrinomonadaceae bacterium]